MSTMRAGVVIRQASPWFRLFVACAGLRLSPAGTRLFPGFPMRPVAPIGPSRVPLMLFVIDLGPFRNHAPRRGARTAPDKAWFFNLNAPCRAFRRAMGTNTGASSRLTLPAGRGDREYKELACPLRSHR